MHFDHLVESFAGTTLAWVSLSLAGHFIRRAVVAISRRVGR